MSPPLLADVWTDVGAIATVVVSIFGFLVAGGAVISFSEWLADYFRKRSDAKELKKAEEQARDKLALPALFDLYWKQINSYQSETRSRAAWSFTVAVSAMLLGLGVLVFGGWNILQPGDLSHAISSSTLTVVGSAISGFLAKTFLDVHRTSLIQLNHYFKQPVLNSHILTAQRLIQLLNKDAQPVLNNDAQVDEIRKILGVLLELMRSEQTQSVILTDVEKKSENGKNSEAEKIESAVPATGETMTPTEVR
jgi:hypothetical protein